MKKWQDKVLGEVPGPYKAAFERAYSGSSRTAAIKAFCLRCVGYLRNDVKGCTAYGCPLHPYRPYQDGDDQEAKVEETAEA